MNDDFSSLRPDSATVLLCRELLKTDTPTHNALAMVLESQSILRQALDRNTDITKRTEEQAKLTNGRVSFIESLKLPEIVEQHRKIYDAFILSRTLKSVILLASPLIFALVAVIFQKLIEHFWK